MKIIAINGSHRGENGLTQILIEKLFEGARKAEADCETLVLAKKKINRCQGCYKCQSENSYLQCIFNDDINELYQKVREADIVIYATPIYIFTMSSLLKIFLERIASTADSSIRTVSKAGLLFHHIDVQLSSKPFVLLVSQDNIEDETSSSLVKYFEGYSRFFDAPIAGTLIRKSSFLMRERKDQSFPKISCIYAAYIRAGVELAKFGKISKNTQKVANQNIIPMPKIIEELLNFNFIKKNKAMMRKILEKSKQL